jgi:sec-independent protein translocase protein TatC
MPRSHNASMVDEEREHGNAAMGFLDHLEELRSRLIRSCIAVAAGMGVAALFLGRIRDFVLAPAVLHLPHDTSLIMTRPGEGFSFDLDLALLGGAVLSAPFVTYQVWRFVAPGLYAREKRLVIPFILLAIAATVAGAAFSHYVLFPSMMAFFATFDSPKVRLTPRLEDTFELYKNMLLGMVIVFQLPTLAFVLARIGLVTARLLWRQAPYAVFGCFVVSAVMTPSTDPWNQTLFAIPMMALYLISIVVAWLVAPRSVSIDTAARLVVGAAVIDQAWRFGSPRTRLSRRSS